MIELQLSIIIPTLNEAENLPLLLQDIMAQQGVGFEILISDGGSSDQTCRTAARLLADYQIPHQVLSGPASRGRQMNLAVAAARGQWLLFLHADCRLYDNTLLQKGLELVVQACRADASCRVAGRFGLKFDLSEPARHLGFFFYEAKARLNEAGCIHGDQGFLLARQFFEEVGPFREDLPVMEDTSLAEVIRTQGEWLLLPSDIYTSARRFEVEGLAERQTLNALLMNFLFIGWEDFFRQVPAIYRQQDRTGVLDLRPFRHEINRLLKAMPLVRRCRLWYATGRYVRGQAWQVAFYREVRYHFLAGRPVSMVSSRKHQRFRKWFDRLTDNPAGILLAALVTQGWFLLKFGRQPPDRE